MGPYTLQSPPNIGEAADGSPVTQAQQRAVVMLPGVGGGTSTSTTSTSTTSTDATYLHVSNNWVPGNGGQGTCSNGGLLYWYPLQFAPDGSIRNITWEDTVQFELEAPQEEISSKEAARG
jgi:hypothetical protein